MNPSEKFLRSEVQRKYRLLTNRNFACVIEKFSDFQFMIMIDDFS